MSWTALHIMGALCGPAYLKGAPSELEIDKSGPICGLAGTVNGRRILVNPGMVAYMEEIPDEDMCRCGSCGWVGERIAFRVGPDEDMCPACCSEDIREARRCTTTRPSTSSAWTRSSGSP